jgi:hypothetical protein
VIVGIYDENDAPLDLTVKYRNRTAHPYRTYLKD